MKRPLIIFTYLTVLAVSAAGIAWAVTPAGTMPGQKSLVAQTKINHVLRHRTVRVVKVVKIHDRPKPVAAVSSGSVSSPAYGGSYQSTPSAGSSGSQPPSGGSTSRQSSSSRPAQSEQRESEDHEDEYEPEHEYDQEREDED